MGQGSSRSYLPRHDGSKARFRLRGFMVSLEWDQIPPTQRDYVFHMNVENGFREYGLLSMIETRNIKISHKTFCFPVTFSTPEEYVEVISKIYNNACNALVLKHGNPRDPERLWREVLKQVKLWYGQAPGTTTIPIEKSGRLYAVVINSPAKDTIFPNVAEDSPDLQVIPHANGGAAVRPAALHTAAQKLYHHPCLLAEPVERDQSGPYIFFSHLPTGVLQYTRLETFVARGGDLSDPILIGRGYILSDPEEFSHFLQDVEHDVVEEEATRANVLPHSHLFPLVVKKFGVLMKDHLRESGPNEKWVDLYQIIVTSGQENDI